MDLHDVARQVAKTAGADFAFVLSQAGLLVTRDAPRDMPDRGRTKILWACPLGKADIAHLEMPREDLVPYGGAAPVDVFAIRVEEVAIIALVMASWNDKGSVVLALTTAAAELTEMIRKARRVRAQKAAARKPNVTSRRERTNPSPGEPARREQSSASPAEPARRERTSVPPGEPARRERTSALPGEPARRERTSALPGEPARRERTSSLPKALKEAAPAKKPGKVDAVRLDAARSAKPEATAMRAPASTKRSLTDVRPRVSSEPEISIGEAAVGRETLIAIEAALPRGVAGPTPEGVRVELMSMSRESVMEIERIEAAEMARKPSVQEPLVVNDRRTLPWVDTPRSLKLSIEAKAAARAVAPPDVKVTVEELDVEALEGVLGDEPNG